MRHLAPLAVVYLLVAALIVPASPFAAEDEAQQPAEDGAGSAETAPEPAAPPQPPQTPRGPQAPPEPPATAQPVEQPPAEPAARDAPTQPDTKPIARAAAPGSVTIKDFSFGPAAVTVSVGESVTWTNSGPTAHTATAGDGSFDTGLLSRGQSRSVSFRKAGSISYVCTPHPNMKGTVRVVAASSGGGAGGGGSEGSSAGSTGAGEVNDQGATAGSTGVGEVDDSGATLPKSGAEAEALAALGLLLLLLGASTYRRVGW